MIGRHFIIKTDHFSLKYLLGQKISTLMQQKWVTKLMGSNFDIVFKTGQENKVADALSRQGSDEEGNMAALSIVQIDWLATLNQAWQQDLDLKTLIEELTTDPTSHDKYSWSHGVLTYKGRLVVGPEKGLKHLIMLEVHASLWGAIPAQKGLTKRPRDLFIGME